MTVSTRRRKATLVGGVAVAMLLGVLFVVSARDDPAAKAPPAGEEITITADVVEFGDRLVGFVDRVATDDGEVYVLPGRSDEPLEAGDAPPFRTETAVLAAFDDGGTERWRTELDRTPTDVVVVDGDPWVSHGDGTVTRIDSSDGRLLGDVTIEHGGNLPLVGAFGSVWAAPRDSSGRSSRLVRIDPDLSTTNIELGCDCPTEGPIAGAGAIWVPLRHGVAMIDPDTDDVTVIPVDGINGDEVRVAVDGDVAYVASNHEVTSIIDGEVGATVSPGEIWYLGPIDGVFGALLRGGRFEVLHANEPILGELRWISLEGMTGPVGEIDGEAWMETGLNYDLRRVELLPAS